MATTQDYIEFVVEQIHTHYPVRRQKMFGEYTVYVNEKPFILVCDNTVYVPILPEIAELMANAGKGIPYQGAKERYILDIEDTDTANKVIDILARVVPMPKHKKGNKQ
ncbi:MAG: TfoX/Sxy family protein [Christensenellaceae bacterium]|jgi:TfoX/Sxy family transcriptional regulator of competence genes|nr:TfoX/Sxy family protein [Christensenellaceae bacterium]